MNTATKQKEITRALVIDSDLIAKYNYLPLKAFELFINSYVQLNSKINDNQYIVKNNNIYIATRNDNCNSIFHELAHFALARDSRLHLTNYGYEFPYHHPTRWDDLNCEIQVLALEDNINEYYGCKQIKKRGQEAEVWSFLKGWSNFQKHHKLTNNAMKIYAQKRYEHWRKIHTVDFFFQEWQRKNTLLSKRMKKTKTIIP